MHSRKRSTPKPKKRKITAVSVEENKSPKDEEDNLCPVCEDSCNCGKSGAPVVETVKAIETSEDGLEGSVGIHLSPLKKRVLVEYSTNTSPSGILTDDGFTSEDEHIAYLYTDTDCSSLSEVQEVDDYDCSSDSSDEITFSFSIFEKCPAVSERKESQTAAPPPTQPQIFSQVVVNRPATLIDIYSSYYLSSDSSEDDYDYEDCKSIIKIEDVILESATCNNPSTKTGSASFKESECSGGLGDLERWQKIPINAFRRRTRRLSVPTLEISNAIRNSSGRDSIHSTLFSEPGNPVIFSPTIESSNISPLNHRHSVHDFSNQVNPTPVSIIFDESAFSTCSSPTWSLDFVFEEPLYFWNEI